MSRRKRWLVVPILVFALPVLAGAAALLAVDPNDFKPQLVAAVEQATGRTLTVGGDLSIGKSLWPVVVVSDVSLANLPGGSRPDIAHAERIQARLSLPALLHRRVEITSLELTGPNILFETVAGKPNWVFDTDAGGRAAAAGKAGPGWSLRVPAVHVQNGMVTIRLPLRTHVVGIRSLDLRAPAQGPLDLASVLVYGDNRPFSLWATARPTGGVRAPWDARLRFAAYGAEATAAGTMSLDGRYDLQAQGTAPALEKLDALLPSLRLPPLHGLDFAAHLTSAGVDGGLPVVGQTRLGFAGADLRDRVPGLVLGAVEVALPRAGGDASVKGSGSYAGQDFAFDGSAAVPKRLDGRIGSRLDLSVRARAAAAGGAPAAASKAPAGAGGDARGTALGGAHGTLKGTLGLDAGRFDGLDARVGLRLPSLAALRAVAPSLPPGLPLTDVSFDGQVTLPADLATAEVRGARLSAHEAELSGDLRARLRGEPGVSATLQAARLDLDALAAGSGGHGWQWGGDGPVIPDAALPWGVLRDRTLDLSLAADTVTFLRRPWHDVRLAMTLADGRLRVSQARLAFPDGPLELAMSADAAGRDVPVTLSVHGAAIPLALLADAAGLPGRAAGSLRVEADLAAHGSSAHDLAATLDGPFAATLLGGQLSDAALIDLAGPALKALNIAVPPEGEAAVRCLGLVGRFRNGRGRFPTLALDTGFLRLDGAGEVDLGAETLALRLRPLARLSGASVSVPVVVEGPFRAIGGRLDASAFEKLGLLFDAWLGGDDPKTCSDAGLVAATRR